MEPNLKKPDAKFITQRRVAEASVTVRAYVANRATKERRAEEHVSWLEVPAAVQAQEAAKARNKKERAPQRALIAPVQADQAKNLGATCLYQVRTCWPTSVSNHLL